MDVTRRPLAPKERQELVGIVSVGAALGRAVLFGAIIAAVCGVGWSLNKLTPWIVWWPFLGGIVAWYLYRASSTLTGGRALRALIRQDIASGEVEDLTFTIEEAVVFPEVEDEGPVWCFPDGSKTWCVAGQWLDRISKDGLPRRMLIASLTPHGKRLMRLKATGEQAKFIKASVPFFQCPVVADHKLTSSFMELPVEWSAVIDAVRK